MIILFDKYTEKTKKLQKTMEKLGKNPNIAVLEDNGFLPCRVSSPCEYFALQQNQELYEGRESVYHSLEIPEFWEIRIQGDKSGIYEAGCEKAKIYFTEPKEKKVVQRIEWHMESQWSGIWKANGFTKLIITTNMV